MEKDGALSRHAFKQPRLEEALFAVIYTGFLACVKPGGDQNGMCCFTRITCINTLPVGVLGWLVFG